MIWQDMVLAGAQVFFAVFLLPSIFSKDKPALLTSAFTSFMLFVICFVNFTLNLYGASIGLFIVATLWGVLAFQKYMIDKQSMRLRLKQSLRSKDLKKSHKS